MSATEASEIAAQQQGGSTSSTSQLISAGRTGPSGQPLKGPIQRTTILHDFSPDHSENVLQTPPIELENVRQVYDTIAEHWNHTRYKAWPRVDEFIRRLPPNALVADLGCGNGKNLAAVQEMGGFGVPCDASGPLCKIAEQTFGSSAFVADCLNTPLRGGIYDAVLSIAVLHHLSTEARRVQALREAARLLKPGGQFLVYCWSYEQDDEISRSRHRFDAQDVLVPWKHRTPGVKKPKAKKGAAAAPAAPAAAAAATAADVAAPAAAAAAVADAASAGPSAAAPAGAAEAETEQQGSAADAAPAAASSEQWEESPAVQQRYCHVYREGELPDLLAQVPELEVLEHYFDTGNWCAISRKRS